MNTLVTRDRPKQQHNNNTTNKGFDGLKPAEVSY